MATKTEIANLALSHCGVGKEIANLETEKSEEAVATRRFYDDARKATLRDFPWPFATKYRILALVSDDPEETNDEWDFSYRYPTDCLIVRRIASGLRNEARDVRVPYKVARDDQGLLIYTDEEEAVIEYTVNETDPGRFSCDFVLALSFRLALYVVPRLAKGDPFQLRRSISAQYLQEISMAQASAANEEQPDTEPESEFIRAREGEGFLPPGQGGGRPFGL